MLVLGIMVDYQVEMILFKFPKILFFFKLIGGNIMDLYIYDLGIFKILKV